MRDLILVLVLALVCCAGPRQTQPAVESVAMIEAAFDERTTSSGQTVATTLGYPDSIVYYICPAEDTGETWVEFEVEIPKTGPYRVEIVNVFAQGTLWVEDRTEPNGVGMHGMTGPLEVDHTIGVSGSVQPPYSPARMVNLRAGTHRIRLHGDVPELLVHGLRFSLVPDLTRFRHREPLSRE